MFRKLKKKISQVEKIDPTILSSFTSSTSVLLRVAQFQEGIGTSETNYIARFPPKIEIKKENIT
jgi:hypothetical protein